MAAMYFSTTFLKIVVEVKVSGQPHVLEHVQDHATCEIFPLQQSLFFVSVKFYGDHKTHKIEVNFANVNFGDITRFKTVVSVCPLCT